MALDTHARCSNEHCGVRNGMVLCAFDSDDTKRSAFVFAELVLVFAITGLDLQRFYAYANFQSCGLVVDVVASIGLVFHNAGWFND